MKTNRIVFAAVLVVVTAACSADVTEPQLRAPDSPAAFVASDTTTPPPVPTPGEDPGGMIGSGVGK
ncbi:MAG TPA: hypothetical protein VLK84_14730 [Longimicrobium sp.]|nr:hypothetical protein [Longimicrobium sp.]